MGGGVAETSFTRSLHTRVEEACAADCSIIQGRLHRCVASVGYYRDLQSGRVIQSLVYARYMMVNLYRGELSLSDEVDDEAFLQSLSASCDAQTLCPVYRLLILIQTTMLSECPKDDSEMVHQVDPDQEQKVIRDLALEHIRTAERFINDLKRGEAVLKAQPMADNNIQSMMQTVFRVDDEGLEIDLLFETVLGNGCEARDESPLVRALNNLDAISKFDENHIQYMAFSIWAAIAFYVFGWVLPSVQEALVELNDQLRLARADQKVIAGEQLSDKRLNTSGVSHLTLFNRKMNTVHDEQARKSDRTEACQGAAVIYRAVFPTQ